MPFKAIEPLVGEAVLELPTESVHRHRWTDSRRPGSYAVDAQLPHSLSGDGDGLRRIG